MFWQAGMASNRHIQSGPLVREKMVARLKLSLEGSQYPSCCEYVWSRDGFPARPLNVEEPHDKVVVSFIPGAQSAVELDSPGEKKLKPTMKTIS